MGSPDKPRAMVGLLTLLLVSPLLLTLTSGHGMITDPPARNAMWRYGYTNPVNYDDNELYCGGFSVQWNQNEGKCGVCGDNFADPEPRPHEAGGRYGNGIIGRRYTMGQTIDIEIDISANHWGHFELKICPVDGKKSVATQECFDKHPLTLADNQKSHQYYIPLDSPKITKFNYKVVLPYGLTCSQCVMQWTYYTGNTWGVCANGTEGMGCGYQETFRNCADVQINSIIGAYPPNAFAPTRRTIYQRTRDKCKCLSHCEAIGRLAGVEGTDVFCHRNCLRYPPNCPKESCKCHAAEDAVSVPDGDAIVDTRLTPKYLQFLSGYGVIPIA